MIGIRLKISLGFAVLTIVVISAVSFWAAQSLGVTLDSSDLERLEKLKSQLKNELTANQNQLDRVCSETAQVLTTLGFFSLPEVEQQRLAEKLKSSLNLAWLEIFVASEPLLFYPQSKSEINIKNGVPIRLSSSGPFSYSGYMASKKSLPGQKNTTLLLARKPDLSKTGVPLYCIFDQQGILASSHELPSSLLRKLAETKTTDQIQVKETLFRLRAFTNQQNDFFLVAGYPADRAVISRASLNQLMLRIAMLEVLGLLILGFFLGRKLLLPLRSLQHAIEQVAAGHWKEIPLNEPPMLGSGEEIETVAKSFNHMVRELSLAQARLIDVQKELGKKDKMAALGRFSAGIAHEINNPLGTILVTAGMLKEAAVKGVAIHADEFDEIIEEVKRCRDIIATLRTFTSKLQPSLKRIKIRDFAEEIHRLLVEETEFKSLELELQNNFAEDSEIEIDLKAMHRVFFNLVKNAADALEASDSKHVKLHFDQQEMFLLIKIQDQGKGFSCQPEQIFEPLVTSKAQGTGLGLVICQAIVEGHNGKIEAERIKNEITEFRIFIPLPTGSGT